MVKSIATLLLLAVCTSSHALGPSCTPQTTRGTWAVTCEGQLPAPAPTPTRMLATCTASPTGYWTCNGTVNLGGQIIPHSLEGQAHTRPDCTGTISYAQTLGGAPAGTLDIEYVISGGGRTIDGLPTNSGGVLSCSLRRIGRTVFDW